MVPSYQLLQIHLMNRPRSSRASPGRVPWPKPCLRPGRDEGSAFFEKPTWEWCHGSWEYVWIYIYIYRIYIYWIYTYIIKKICIYNHIYIPYPHIYICIYICVYIYISVWEPVWFQTLIKQHQMNDGYGYVQEWRMPQRIVREFVQGEIWRSSTKHNE